MNENEKQYKENLKQSEIANVLFNEKREESLTADETKEKLLKYGIIIPTYEEALKRYLKE